MWTSEISINNQPAMGSISYFPKYGKAGQTLIKIHAWGTEYTETGGQIAYYCGGTIRFYTTGSNKAQTYVTIQIQWMP